MSLWKTLRALLSPCASCGEERTYKTRKKRKRKRSRNFLGKKWLTDKLRDRAIDKEIDSERVWSRDTSIHYILRGGLGASCFLICTKKSNFWMLLSGKRETREKEKGRKSWKKTEREGSEEPFFLLCWIERKERGSLWALRMRIVELAVESSWFVCVEAELVASCCFWLVKDFSMIGMKKHAWGGGGWVMGDIRVYVHLGIMMMMEEEEEIVKSFLPGFVGFLFLLYLCRLVGWRGGDRDKKMTACACMHVCFFVMGETQSRFQFLFFESSSCRQEKEKDLFDQSVVVLLFLLFLLSFFHRFLACVFSFLPLCTLSFRSSVSVFLSSSIWLSIFEFFFVCVSIVLFCCMSYAVYVHWKTRKMLLPNSFLFPPPAGLSFEEGEKKWRRKARKKKRDK